MHVIIDGYNLIRQSVYLRRFERLSLEEGRRALIRTLGSYRRCRGHRITIVFDGWEGGQATEERDRQEGLEIVYSRLGEKADDVIKRLVETRAGETVVVSSDRAIAVFADRRGATTISSPDFEALVSRTVAQSPEAGPGGDAEEEESAAGRKKKGPARRPSRREKNLLTALKKL